MALSIGGYLGVTAALQLVVGPLSDRHGRRPVLLGSLALFVLASVGCALATDIRTLLAFRMLQGAVIGGAVISRAVVRDMMPPREAAGLLGTIAMAMAVAPMLAPVLGGALDQAFGWRASFWAFAAFGGALLAWCWTDLGETNASPSATFGAQLRAYPELVRSRRFWGFSLCMTFSIGAFYVFLSGAPLVAGRLFGLSPAQVGALLGSITAGFAPGRLRLVPPGRPALAEHDDDRGPPGCLRGAAGGAGRVRGRGHERGAAGGRRDAGGPGQRAHRAVGHGRGAVRAPRARGLGRGALGRAHRRRRGGADLAHGRDRRRGGAAPSCCWA